MKGCGDHGCLIEKPTGMGTNGRCRCPAWKLQAAMNQLRGENERLRTALHDAINRPLGVVPDSALEFYEARQALNAEMNAQTSIEG